MSVSGLPFDDIRALFTSLPEPDERVAAAARARNDGLFGEGAFGDAGFVTAWLAAWSGKSPTVARPLVAIFAGTHGAQSQEERERVSASVARIAAGGAPVNQVCSTFDLGLKIFDLALQFPTGDIREGEALSERDAAATIAFGMESISGGVDLLCVADCGSSADISAPAIFAAIHGGGAERWCGRDGNAGRVAAALACHDGHLGEPLEVLRRLGGRETCAMAGAILAARVEHIPVILDGPGALAAAAILKAAAPAAIDHCLIGQASSEGRDGAMLAALAKRPLLGLSMSLNAGEGAALAAGMVKAMATMHSGTVVPSSPAASS